MLVRDILRLIVSVAISNMAGLLGSIATMPAIDSWYRTLEKPAFNPPDWVFAPVWTILYILMGIAAWLIWRQGLEKPGVRTALAVFIVQLVLNALWSWIFFGWGMLGPAFIEIIFLWAAILTTIILFFRLSRVAGALLVPYILWVSFASVLNFAVWQLNR